MMTTMMMMIVINMDDDASPYVSWDRLQRPRDPNEDEAVLIMDGWMDA